MGPSKQLEQIMQLNILTLLKNPNWLVEANQLAIYKSGRGFEHMATGKQFQAVVGTVKAGTAGMRVRRADHSVTPPPDKRKDRSIK